MSGIDIILGVLVLIGAYRGYRRGFLMEVILLVAIILGVLCGFKLLGVAMGLLNDNFQVHASILPYVAFGAVFILVVIGVSFLGRMIKSSLDQSFLGKVDQAMGALVGVFKIVFLVSIICWLISSLTISFPESWEKESWLFPVVSQTAPVFIAWVGKIIPVFKDTLF